MSGCAPANIEGARRREVDAKDTATPRWLAFGILGWMLAMGKPAVGGDALLVMSRDRAQDVKKAVDALTAARRHDVL